ncbi:nucleolar complex protein 3 homolog isoform X1 [Micropterus salmoides]|uniref:nucleolar complex protein 3 homolog isoform X1 n=1 Tax=Micropterus salmoides TaxID=27706 RepID=UPI0018EAFC87|nr:nucleolar complex protein 3 homolog isoform X1 [Micropterus salmoides]XP_038554075.1 nucleolar complex protein 3 homolog isoform X1 [Micropterus salmoides]XP_038554076.1 nucleolar complex protein 3 homolog isoform X1 [Micropterus salmoides]
MGPPRSKKRRPTFRRLLKTSGVKLENKLKNRQLKQQNVAKKQRKEQKKLRQAVKDAAIRMPRPLETYRKRPEEEEDEEFLESLPTDMIEDEDLQQMTAMARHASFITRDLSSCGPVHGGKKRSSEVVRSYEKVPRKMARTEEKEVIHLLPIKDKTGVIPQSVERVVKKQPEEEDEEEDAADQPQEFENEGEPESAAALTAEQREKLRVHKINQRKLSIASLGSAIISDPYSNMKRVKELRGMLMESDPCVAVTVRKLVMVSLMEIFKDITPSYRIRPLTPAEKAAKVKKETQQLREFEEVLVSQYKFYLEDLEQTIKDWKQQKKKRSQAVGFQSYLGLAEVAVRCLCELLLALPHFNFHNNIIVALVPLMNDPVHKVSAACCDAFRKLFQQDKEGGASLATVRVISGLIKSLNYNVKPEVLRTLLSLRIKEVDMKRDIEDTAPKKKFMNNKEKKKQLSRMQRKWKKAEEKLEKELLEAEASDSKEKKIKLHTETLNIVFLVYFRILKKAQKSLLLPAVLEGLANFAHLINLEFFDDLLNVLQNLIQSGDLTNRESLHCIQTVFTILSGQGDVLNIDPLNFYSQLYRMLLRLHAGAPNDDIIIVLRCLDAMLTRRKKQVTLQRAMAFVKRLSTLSLHVLPNASVGILAASRATVHAFPKCDFLLDNEVQGSGFYLPELDEPEHCNAQNTALWELHTLQRHYHPVVRRLASHLCQGAPSEGSAALGVELSRRSPVELFNMYSVRDMTFNPPVAPPATKKKDRFVVGATLLDTELQRQAQSVLTAAGAEEAELDFYTTHTHIHTEH